MFSPESKKLLKEILNALKETKQRAIMMSGWCNLAGGLEEFPELKENVLVLEDVPHSWLFPRVSFIIHHGGAGSTGAGKASFECIT